MAYSISGIHSLKEFLGKQEFCMRYQEPAEVPFISVLLVPPRTAAVGVNGARLLGSFPGRGDLNTPVYEIEISNPNPPPFIGKWWLVWNKKKDTMRLVRADLRIERTPASP